jgi:hypothetical protein
MAHLTNEQKTEILNQRLAQFETEKYQHELNKEVALALDEPAQAEQADQAILIIDTAIEVHQTKLDELSQ